MLSFVVPMLDEEDAVARRGVEWRALRAAGHEIIAVDGGSSDATCAVARRHADRLCSAPRGRASQMNAGAALARGSGLVFVHADTRLPARAAALVESALATGSWGRFDVRLDDPHPALRVVEALMNWRSALTGIATGDQGMFVRASLFREIGGFPDLRLMEDIAISRTLRAVSWPVRVRTPAVTSARRWRGAGIARTVVLMWRLRAGFALGESADSLAVRYSGGRRRP